MTRVMVWLGKIGRTRGPCGCTLSYYYLGTAKSRLQVHCCSLSNVDVGQASRLYGQSHGYVCEARCRQNTDGRRPSRTLCNAPWQTIKRIVSPLTIGNTSLWADLVERVMRHSLV